MRYLLAGVVGALGGMVYLVFFLSRADVEPIAVFAAVGLLTTVLDVLISRYVARRNNDLVEVAPRSVTRALLRSAGVFAVAFLSGLGVSVLFVFQMAP